MQIPENLIPIVEKWLAGTANAEEKQAVYEWYHLPEQAEMLVLTNEEDAAFKTEERIKMRLKRSLEELNNSSDELGVVRKMPVWKRVAVAASILLVVGLGTYFVISNSNTRHSGLDPESITQTTDVPAPDKNRAQITLADGTVVYLDSAGSGTLATAGNVTVVKNEDGEIVYNGTTEAVEYNTMFNPRGSKVQPLTLSDGTKVWLNSESSIKYPTAFSGNERRVEITGEAYFEVAKHANKKFLVVGNGVTTEVLGTHFNVNAYDDEADIKITLLEGSVKVSNTVDSKIIKPGQQALTTHDSRLPDGALAKAGLTINHSPDIEAVMAWKNGRFELTGDMQSIMRQIARWYDVTIEYNGNVTDKKFGGTLSREENVSKVLKYLELTGSIHFKIEDKKIIVMP